MLISIIKLQSLSLIIISINLFQSLASLTDKYNITGYAGNSTFGYFGENVNARSAMMKVVKGVWASTANNVYLSDSTNFRVRLVDSSHIITTFSGGSSGSSGDGGPASSAQISTPWGLYGDSVNSLYITSFGANCIRKVILSSGLISTFAGTGVGSTTSTASNGDNGDATAATLNGPNYVFVDSVGRVFIADTGNNKVRKVTTSGIITTVAGTGTYAVGGEGVLATSLSFKSVTGLWLDTAGNMFIGDAGFRLRRIDASLNTGVTFAGTGTSGNSGDGGAATSATVGNNLVAWANSVSQLFLSSGNQIRGIDLTDSSIRNIAGSSTGSYSGNGGMAVDATLKNPLQVYGTATGHYYVADSSNFVLRQLMVAPIAPTAAPSTMTPTSASPSLNPTSSKPTVIPTSAKPTAVPSTRNPTTPTVTPTLKPTAVPSTTLPSESPTTALPTEAPSIFPSRRPTTPTQFPALRPSPGPTYRPTFVPTFIPTVPTVVPTSAKPSTIRPSPTPTTIAPTRPTVTPTTRYPSVVPTSAFPSVTHPSPIPTLFPPTVKPTRSPTTFVPSPAPSFSPTQPYRDIWFTSTLCFHRIPVQTLTATDKLVIASTVADVLDLNATLVYVTGQDYIGVEGSGYQVCADVYCQARTLHYSWVVDSNATQLYVGLVNILEQTIANGTFFRVLNDTATNHSTTHLSGYTAVDTNCSPFEVIVFIPPTDDDWLSPEEVGGVTVVSILGTLVALSFGLAVCSVMEEKGF